ncbi:hypothetical protein [Ktedonobacter racemifer]|uniref:hypothetical protein n=1 Tax=Ktedonobacter racemifer TaxID=363277 RepID=UPI0012F9B067|nr:hypothetical protein [Ktedonobacter racemifer]
MASEREEEKREYEARQAGAQLKRQQMQGAVRAQDEALKRQKVSDLQETHAKEESEKRQKGIIHELDPVRDTIGGRNASMERTAFGDQDARHERFPQYDADPMTARSLRSWEDKTSEPVADEKAESPWKNLIRGRSLEDETR